MMFSEFISSHLDWSVENTKLEVQVGRNGKKECVYEVISKHYVRLFHYSIADNLYTSIYLTDSRFVVSCMRVNNRCSDRYVCEKIKKSLEENTRLTSKLLAGKFDYILLALQNAIYSALE